MDFTARYLAYLASQCPQTPALRCALDDMNNMRSGFQLPQTSVPLSALPFLYDLQFARSIGFDVQMDSGRSITEYLDEATNVQTDLAAWLCDRVSRNSYLHNIILDEVDYWLESNDWGVTNEVMVLYESAMDPDRILIPWIQVYSTRNPKDSEKHFFSLYDLTRIALTARIYELEKGDSPTSVGQLVGPYLTEEPLDPYSKRSFLYDSVHDKFYSVGVNGLDDHGQTDAYGLGVGDDLKALPEMRIDP
jgi:hypothetical protein